MGDFKSAGRAWVLEASAVNMHGVPGDALGRVVPQGVYDVTKDVALGTAGPIHDVGAPGSVANIVFTTLPNSGSPW